MSLESVQASCKEISRRTKTLRAAHAAFGADFDAAKAKFLASKKWTHADYDELHAGVRKLHFEFEQKIKGFSLP